MTWLWNILMKYAVLNLSREVQYWTIVDILYHFFGQVGNCASQAAAEIPVSPIHQLNCDRWRSGIANMSPPDPVCLSRRAGGIWAPNLVCWCPTLCLLSLGFPKELLLIVPQRWKHLWTRIWVNQLTRKSLNEIRSSVTQRCPFFVLV